MYTACAKLTFHIAHAASLKDKRQVSRSLVDSVGRKFNASVAEVDTQDAHKTLTIGVAVVSGCKTHASECLQKILRYMEEKANGDLVGLWQWHDAYS